MSVLRSPIVLLVPATAGLVVAAIVFPSERGRAVGAFLLLGAALGLWTFVRTIQRVWPTEQSLFERALQTQETERPRLRELARLEGDLMHGTSDPRDFQGRLKPVLREIAAQRLAWRHGAELAANPDAARKLLGQDAWEVIVGDPQLFGPNSRRRDRIAKVRAAIDALERL